MTTTTFPNWRRRSSVPPLPDEWLVSLFGYRFYGAGQIVNLPTEDSVPISCEDFESGHGIVVQDTLFDAEGRVILLDHDADWIENQLRRERV